MKWKEFRNLTKDIPDEEDVLLDVYGPIIDYELLTIDKEKTIYNFTNDYILQTCKFI